MQTDDTQPNETGSKPTVVPEDVPKARRALSRLKRELSDDDLGSPGVQKMLLDYLERAEDENESLKSFREKFHQVDKRNDVLQEKLKTNTAAEVVSTGCIAIGAAAIVYAPVAWSSQPTGWIALAFGIILTGVGIVAKVIRG